MGGECGVLVGQAAQKVPDCATLLGSVPLVELPRLCELQALRLQEELSASPPCLCSFTTHPCTWSGLQWASSLAQHRRRRNPEIHQQALQKRTGQSQKPVRAAFRVSRGSGQVGEGGWQGRAPCGDLSHTWFRVLYLSRRPAYFRLSGFIGM